MSSDSSNSSDMARQRRGSVTSATAFTNLFRSNSISQGPGLPITSAALNDPQRRRLSITTLGLSGTSAAAVSASTPFMRRASLSTNNSDSTIDENAIEEDDGFGPKTAPTTPFTRRMSFGANQAMRAGMRGPTATSPGSVVNGRLSPPLRRSSMAARAAVAGPPSPPIGGGGYYGTGSGSWSKISSSSQASTAKSPRAVSDMPFSPARPDQGFNWSEQLRSRAENSVASSGSRGSFPFASGLSASPPRGGGGMGGGGHQSSPSPHHDRAKSVSDIPAPPVQAPRSRQPIKPDPFQERILKGDFYMD
ncbi:hypothetical protein QBC46DRAFT_109524 [Diplogelasinospora grovesii]|uniref:Uncharacterized protein n=1 Tax=Diplogelasinospora grovesii TaxID=303347 RepID=A0AAN6N9D9_9PEZI|nr:hypothetical protein QBC46DRAFT_109524 [Diplogelasinospora grovesii]